MNAKDSSKKHSDALTAAKAREIVENGPLIGMVSSKYYEAKGYLEALEGPETKALVKALEYCAVEPERLMPEHNRQNAVAINALAKFEEAVGDQK